MLGTTGEDLTAIEALQRYVAVRPDTSTAAVTVKFRSVTATSPPICTEPHVVAKERNATEITAENRRRVDVGVRAGR